MNRIVSRQHLTGRQPPHWWGLRAAARGAWPSGAQFAPGTGGSRAGGKNLEHLKPPPPPPPFPNRPRRGPHPGLTGNAPFLGRKDPRELRRREQAHHLRM